jgi:signal transduction histidine kinase
MKRSVLLFLLVILAIRVSGKEISLIPDMSKYKTIEEKVRVLKRICDSLNEVENYAAIKEVARFSLQQLPADPNNIALFTYYLGSVYEKTLNRDSAFYYHETSLAAAKRAGNGNRIRVALQRLLFLYYSAGNKAKSTQTAKALQAILDTTKSEISRYEMLVFLGNYFSENGQYEENIQYLVRSLQIQKKLLIRGEIKDSSDIAITQLNIANTFLKIKQPEKALEYIRDSKPYTVNYEISLSFYYESMVEALLMLNKEESANIYYDSLYTKARAGFASAFGKNDVISTELAFSEHYLLAGQEDSALLFINRTLQKAKEWSSEYQQAQVNGVAGRIFAATGDYQKALTYLKTAEPLSRDANLESYAPLLLCIAQCYSATGQWQQASLYYSRYAPLRDSLYLEASRKGLAEAEAKYQNKQKQQRIETQNTQLSYGRKQRLWLIAGLSLLGLVAVLLVIIYRNKKRTADVLDDKNKKLAQLNNDLEEANRTKAKLFGIISHDLRSPISQVYQFLKLQQLDPERLNEEQKATLSNKIQTATGSLLETMEDLLLWSKTQMNAFVPDIQKTELKPILDQCLALLRLNIDAKQIEIVHNLSDDIEVMADPYFLQTIFRNLLQNAVKAAPAHSKIDIEYKQNVDKATLFVTNEGDGFSQQDYERLINSKEDKTSLSGLGLRLVHELAQKTSTQILFTSDSTARTTSATVTLPLK